MKPKQKRLTLSAAAFLVVAAFASGCSPNVASIEEGGSSASSGGAAREPAAPAPAPTISNDSNLPRSPFEAAMPGGGVESIDEALAKMTPEQHTEVMLRYVSLQLLLYFSIYREYPSTEAGLNKLLGPVDPPPAGRGNYEPIAKQEHLLDGWGNKFTYQDVTREDGVPFFKLRSLGPDGVESEDDRAPDMEEEVAEVTAQVLAGALDR